MKLNIPEGFDFDISMKGGKKAGIRQMVQEPNLFLNHAIHSYLKSQEAPESLIRFMLNPKSGKLRPKLYLTASAICNPSSKPNLLFAVALELMHTASLIHDDVLDLSEERRGDQSIPEQLGISRALLLGNIAYSYVMKILSEERSWPVFDLFNDTLSKMLEAESYMVHAEKDTTSSFDRMTEAELLHINKYKTATLFGLCFEIPVVLTNPPTEIANSLCSFGNHFGMFYQLADDILDAQNELSDLQEGKVTLPTFYAYSKADENDKQLLRASLNKFDPANLNEVIGIIQKTASIEKARLLALEYYQKAKEQLSTPGLNESGYAEELLAVLDQVHDCIKSIST